MFDLDDKIGERLTQSDAWLRSGDYFSGRNARQASCIRSWRCQHVASGRLTQISCWLDVTENGQIGDAHEQRLLLHRVKRQQNVGSLIIRKPARSVQLNHFGVQALVDVGFALFRIKINIY